MRDIDNHFTIARDMLAAFEEDFRDGTVSEDIASSTLTEVVGALYRRGRPYRLSNKPPRGLGYGQPGKPETRPDGSKVTFTTPDDAMIVASLPWFRQGKKGNKKENLSGAIKAHYPTATQDEVNNHADRIRGHRREIEEFEGVLPWETSSNWLGDLPEE